VAQTYMIQLVVEADEVDWEVFAIDKQNVWESLEHSTAAVLCDAVYDAGRVLEPFMPEWLQ
jgi:hypothetical protein